MHAINKEIPTVSGAGGGLYVILGSVLAMVTLIFSAIVILTTVFGYKHKQSCTRKNSRHNEGFQVPAGPLYEEIVQPNSTIPEHQEIIELQENVAYGPIVRI